MAAFLASTTSCQYCPASVAHTPANDLLVATTPAEKQPRFVRVLFVGNSLTYVNDLPGMVGSLSNFALEKPRMSVDALVTGGGDLRDRWREGVLKQLLDSKRFDVVVLQERGGTLRCLAPPTDKQTSLFGTTHGFVLGINTDTPIDNGCANSVAAHKAIVAHALKVGVRPLLLGTWGRDTRDQNRLSAGLEHVAKLVGAQTVDAGATLRAMSQLEPATAWSIDDDLHPSVRASTVIAIALSQTITKRCLAARTSLLSYTETPPETYFSADKLRSLQSGGFVRPMRTITANKSLIGAVTKFLYGDTGCGSLFK
jgi:hypothetical protein